MTKPTVYYQPEPRCLPPSAGCVTEVVAPWAPCAICCCEATQHGAEEPCALLWPWHEPLGREGAWERRCRGSCDIVMSPADYPTLEAFLASFLEQPTILVSTIQGKDLMPQCILEASMETVA